MDFITYFIEKINVTHFHGCTIYIHTHSVYNRKRLRIYTFNARIEIAFFFDSVKYIGEDVYFPFPVKKKQKEKSSREILLE